MKFLTVFAALIAVAFGHQAAWTLPQLSEAIQNPNTDPALLPYLEQALNEIMAALYSGQQVEAVAVSIPAIDLSTWTLHQLSEAIQNPSTDPTLLPYLEQALNEMMLAIVSGQPQEVIAVAVPAMDVSSWTLTELSHAIQNPSTNPALVPILENALNDLMATLASGQQQESIAIAIPAGLLPVESPIAPIPVVPSPVETPVVPAPVESPSAPAAPSSPLVQIIVNINQQSGTAAVPVAPVMTPEAVDPVIVVDQAAEPESVADEAAVPVIVVDEVAGVPINVVDQVAQPIEPIIVSPIIVPEPVNVAPVQVNPIDAIAISPPEVQPVAVDAGPMI